MQILLLCHKYILWIWEGEGNDGGVGKVLLMNIQLISYSFFRIDKVFPTRRSGGLKYSSLLMSTRSGDIGGLAAETGGQKSNDLNHMYKKKYLT